VRVDVENMSNGLVEALWALGAPEPKKWLKRLDNGLGCGGKRAENSDGAVFCRFFTQTYSARLHSRGITLTLRFRTPSCPAPVRRSKAS
jgi:hypothetical protein